MTDLLHTDPEHVTDVKVTEIPASGHTSSGYGGRIPTQYMIKYLGRWRRVLTMVYGNSGSPYVNHGGQIAHLDIDTSYWLEALGKGHGQPCVSIDKLEQGDRFRFQHDGVVCTLTVTGAGTHFKYSDYTGEHMQIPGSYSANGNTAWPYVYPTEEPETIVTGWRQTY